MSLSGKNSADSSSSSTATTQWSLVLGLRQGSEDDRAHALEELCKRYWLPVYSFIRRQGHDHLDAQDHTQSFFATMLSREAFQLADQERGKFRSFLFTCLQRHLQQDWRRNQAQKRNHDQPLLSLDFEEGQSLYQLAPDDSALSPDQAWNRKWAQSVIQQVMDRLQDEFQAAGKLDLFHAIKPFLTTDKGEVSYQKIADQLNMGLNSLRTAIFRLRQKYARTFRNEIAQTVGEENDIDEEIRDLLASLAP